MAHQEFGKEILARVFEDVKDLVQDVPDLRMTRLEGRNLTVMLYPTKH